MMTGSLFLVVCFLWCPDCLSLLLVHGRALLSLTFYASFSLLWIPRCFYVYSFCYYFTSRSLLLLEGADQSVTPSNPPAATQSLEELDAAIASASSALNSELEREFQLSAQAVVGSTSCHCFSMRIHINVIDHCTGYKVLVDVCPDAGQLQPLTVAESWLRDVGAAGCGTTPPGSRVSQRRAGAVGEAGAAQGLPREMFVFVCCAQQVGVVVVGCIVSG